MANDPYWPSVVAALHLTEETAVDYAGNRVTASYNAARVEDATALGGYAWAFDGYQDMVSLTNDSKEYYIFEPVDASGLRSFCVEARIFLTNTDSGKTIARRGASSTDGWSFTVNGGIGQLIFTMLNTSGGTFVQVAATDIISLNTWHHVEACIEASGSGQIARLFVDGVCVATEFGTNGTYYQSAAATVPLRIGCGLTAASSFAGRIQEFLLTLAARDTSDFTPRTDLFGTEPAYFTGTVKDASDQPIVATIRAHRRSDGASYGETESSWTDGSFSAPAMDDSPHYIVAHILDENSLIFDNVTLA